AFLLHGLHPVGIDHDRRVRALTRLGRLVGGLGRLLLGRLGRLRRLRCRGAGLGGRRPGLGAGRPDSDRETERDPDHRAPSPPPRHEPLLGNNARLALARFSMTTRPFFGSTASWSCILTSMPWAVMVVPVRLISTGCSVKRFRSLFRQDSSGVLIVRPSFDVTTTLPVTDTSRVSLLITPSSAVTVHSASLEKTRTTTFFMTVRCSLSKTSAWSASRVQRRLPSRVSLMWISRIR